MSSSKVWPYSIAISIFLIFIAAVVTVVIALRVPVQESNDYMMNYHQADDKANEIIKNSIEFNKKYRVEYVSSDFGMSSVVLKYKISDVSQNAINNAKIKVVLTRPDTHNMDIELDEYSVNEGIYTFNEFKLPKEGRWEIIAKITIDNYEKYYNIKASTLNKETIEF